MPKKQTKRGSSESAKGKTANASGDAATSARSRKRKTTPSKTEVLTSEKQGKRAKKEPTGDEPSTSAASEKKEEIKKLSFSGTVPIDENCKECQTGYHVFREYVNVLPPQDCTYNAMLNQTHIGDNNNKYYVLQLLKNDTKPEYITWFRWGRVGKIAATTLKRHGANVDAAREMFAKKFREKTGNIWWFRKMFTKIKGKYDLLEMGYGKDEQKQIKNEFKLKQKKSDSKLDKRVEEVIDLIFDIKEFEACVKEMEFDIKKAPLGKLTTKQIKAGYETLKKIEKCIQKKKLGKELEDACSEFYTRIPHDFGMKKPPLIKTPEQLKQKIDLLEALSDIQIAIQMISDDEKDGEVNIKDRHYQSLGCKLEPLDKSHEEFKLVKKYVANSYGSTHWRYILDVENVYQASRETDEKRFKKDVGNRMLLWHGSRLTNWCGILSQGLRIAPPEAPVTGYMFGKGVYFADLVSKSANYCCASQRQSRGLLLLSEVALGQTNDKMHADYNANQLPKGKSSTRGMGREVPDPKGQRTLRCGTVVPLGKVRTAGASDRHLMHNEYIVYDVAQIKPRYLVKVKFGGPGIY